MTERKPAAAEDIAIVGMAVHVPGAADVDAFWENLRGGVESIVHLTPEQLREAGEDPALAARPNYVPATAPMEGFDRFDAEFFGFSPKDAAILDPQHRKFLELSWEAMEQAGHPPESIAGPIGVYAGCGMGSYFYFNICSNPELVEDVGMFLLRHTGNDKDFLSTRVSHVFDLKGPSLNLQTACSTSLVAIHYACAALRAGEVDMAVAGGVTIELPQGRGYLFKENEILSPDGHCHAFDHRAQGTVFGSGAGVVTLRRLSDALADGDPIWAVIKGSAVNNDGAAKAGYLAPSVEGQAEAVRRALADAGVSPESIGMVECHGTGTYLGDPIEIAALTDAYRRPTEAKDFARIGSVKTNIGHLDTAAGVAGLAKAALALHYGQIPPSLNYEAPNPAIPFEGSPFRVNDSLHDWTVEGGAPRRAAVNALGVGGTNAHAILEEPPTPRASEDSDWPFHILCLSGVSSAALEANATALAEHLEAHPQLSLADVSWTLKEGRRGFAKRRVLVAETPQEAAALLQSADPQRVFTHEVLGGDPEIVFMFPGGGAQYPNMARDLYETEPVFAEWMDRGLDHLQPQLDYDIRAIWLPEAGAEEEMARRLQKPSVQLPLIAIVETALAQLWLSWGVKPAALIGHSMGENVAACLAGVMTFEALIDLVLLRGRLFDEVPAGGMLSVSAPVAEIEGLLEDGLDIASVNGPDLVAVSGSDAALARLGDRLDAAEIDHRRIAIDIAAHSRMLDPILDRYREFLSGLDLQAPKMPLISNRTGAPLTKEQATDPDYWVEQLRRTVCFADGIETLSETEGRVFLEVGPGKTLSALAQMNPRLRPAQVFSSLRHPEQSTPDDLYFLGVVGRLWACGVEADWAQIWGDARRNRLRLPTYRFQRSRYFIEPGKAVAAERPSRPVRQENIADWGYLPHWQPRYAELQFDPATDLCQTPLSGLFFEDRANRAAPVIAALRQAGHRVVTVRAGDSFNRVSDDRFTLAPEQGRTGYDRLLRELADTDAFPDRIAHFWLADDVTPPRPGSSQFDRNLEQGFWSLTWLAQALAEHGPERPLHLTVFTAGTAGVRGGEVPLFPEKALVQGPVGVLPREVPNVTAAVVDLGATKTAEEKVRGWKSTTASPPADETASLLEELLAEPANVSAARRGEHRFERTWRPAKLPKTDASAYRKGGVYLITGGLGGIGRSLAADILQAGAHVVLLSRSSPPQGAQGKAGYDPRVTALHRLQRLASEHDTSVELVQADVANLAQMRRVIEGITERHGAITGVLHAAGALDDGPLLGKTTASIDAVLAPKVQGLRVIDQLLPDGTIELLVLFSSTSTATRAAGQIDYVAANAWLDAYATARAGDKTRVVTVNWGVWSEIGMAAKALPGEGAVPASGALLDQVIHSPDGRTVFTAELGASDWIIDQHRTKGGQALMPGTGFIELLAEAATEEGDGPPVSLSNLYFLRPLLFTSTETRRLRLVFETDGERPQAKIQSACQAEGTSGWLTHVEATLEQADRKRPDRLDLDAIGKRCGPRRVAEKGTYLAAPQEAQLTFGPQWQVLKEAALGEGEGLARLDLGNLSTNGSVLHPGLLDIATGWAMPLASTYSTDHLWVPVSYGAIRVHAALPQSIWSWVRSRADLPEGEARFDIVIADENGKVLVEIEDFAMQRLEQGFQPQRITASDLRTDDERATATQTAAEEQLAYLVSQGIRPAEGPLALRRALALGKPQVGISSMPLPALVAQADAPPTATKASSQSFERPELGSSFVAPEGDIEQKLAEIWENLLGVSPVGAADSFFDLGGHSLNAVRLFARIKQQFGVEYPISVLFDAPTIRDCAALIAADIGDSPNAGDAAQPEERYEFLVPLNDCKDPDATPLFIVAGMFGNVLNLRHLALPFSGERPVFGIQARGVIGHHEPHRRVAEAAHDYLLELRQRQPQGPYLIGGYSGGGVVAYEMAQQIRDQGEEVAVLALLDSLLPVRPMLSAADKALIKLQEFRRKGPTYALEWYRDRRDWKRMQAGQGDARDEPADDGFNNDKIADAFLEAMAHYEVPAWDGPVTLFRPPLEQHWQVTGGRWVSRNKEFVLPDNGWTRFAPRLEVIEVPGDHDSMVLAPNVTVLTQELREVIAQALDVPQDEWQEATAAQ